MLRTTTEADRFWFPEPYARDQWVRARAASLPPNSRVLDAGAGNCKYRPFFSHCRYETQDFCQYEGPVVVYSQPIDYVCDVAAMPIPPASFDAILCTEVIEHVLEPVKVVQEFARVLKCTWSRITFTAASPSIGINTGCLKQASKSSR
jgi:SAM-dependent methyltransferase